MFSFNWPLIIVTTVVLYILTIIFLPFNAIYATIMLFSLIAFWSRLPGGCIMEPFPILYMMDFVDIFEVIIAMYIGPFQGASFALMWNLYPRLCGAYRPWVVFIKDGVSQALLCLFVPFLAQITGGSLMNVIIIFSILRLPLFLLFSILLPNRSFIEHIIQTTIAGIAVIFINVFYTKLFGDFFTNLVSKGASFSWVLFFVATVIIIVFSITVLGFSPKKTTKRITKHIRKTVKRNIHKKSQNNNSDAEDMKFIRDSMNNK